MRCGVRSRALARAARGRAARGIGARGTGAGRTRAAGREEETGAKWTVNGFGDERAAYEEEDGADAGGDGALDESEAMDARFAGRGGFGGATRRASLDRRADLSVAEAMNGMSLNGNTEDAPFYAEMKAAERRDVVSSRASPLAAARGSYPTLAAAEAENEVEMEDDNVPGIREPTQGWSGGGFDAPEGTVALPISYYQILGLSPARTTPNALPRAALAVMDATLPEGYSVHLHEQRLSLIDEAVAVLKDEDARRQHDADIREGILTPIEPQRAAAALCLLQEAGEYEAVLEFEHVVAQCVSGRRHRKDVALTVALALCEFGHMALMANPPRFAEGCELLEMGSKTLSSVAGNSFAPEVRRNIALMFHDVAPGYVLELLSLPLEAEAERSIGLRALRTLLWTKDPAQQLEQRAAFMEQANELLTAQEQVALFVDAPEYIPVDSDEVYKSALAHVVAGVVDRKPMMIVDADEILHQIQLASAHSVEVSRFADVGVERAVCQILLGQIEEAEHTLGLHDNTADPSLAQYIEDRSPSGDFAEGMCAMADQWLIDVAFPLFRGNELSGTPTVEEWFNTPNVQGFVTRLDTMPALVRIQGAIESAKRAVSSGVGSIVTAFEPTPPALQFGVSDAQRRIIAAAKIGVLATVAFTVSGQATKVNARRVPREPVRSFSPLRAAGEAFSNIKLPTLAPKVSPSRQQNSRPPPVFTMDKGTAEKIVRKWQIAKAQALGQTHNTRPLEGILDGPMLQQWRTRAEDVAAHGWAWEYQLNDLSIDHVQVVGMDKVFVETTLTEVAVLKDRSRNDPDDVYESTYRAKYELKRCREGSKDTWKIVGGSVVY